MSRTLVLKNRQRTRAISLAQLRRMTRQVLEELLEIADYEIGIHLISSREMAVINHTFLKHEGSTDVITFDYTEKGGMESLCGELFISMDDAVTQAREFGTSWQSEIVRYVIHGLLHLLGYDDLTSPGRRRMKREENRLLRETGRRLSLRALGRR